MAKRSRGLTPHLVKRYHGEQMAKTPDAALTPEELEALRQRISKFSLTALSDAYHAAWLRCKLEPGGTPPRAAFVQELVQVWKGVEESQLTVQRHA